VVLLGGIGNIKEGRPTRVMLAKRKGRDFPLVFFKKEVLDRCGLQRWIGEYVRVSGKVALYHGELEIVVTDPAQIEVPQP
jgi:DNA/RNA endonuclease YhcR with UshA esterase domain